MTAEQHLLCTHNVIYQESPLKLLLLFLSPFYRRVYRGFAITQSRVTIPPSICLTSTLSTALLFKQWGFVLQVGKDYQNGHTLSVKLYHPTQNPTCFT